MSTGKDYERLSDDGVKGETPPTDVETTPTDTLDNVQDTPESDKDTPTSPSSDSDTRVITKKELKEHKNTEGEIWIAIDGVVYDVHKFASRVSSFKYMLIYP